MEGGLRPNSDFNMLMVIDHPTTRAEASRKWRKRGNKREAHSACSLELLPIVPKADLHRAIGDAFPRCSARWRGATCAMSLLAPGDQLRLTVITGLLTPGLNIGKGVNSPIFPLAMVEGIHPGTS
jgi:hypothetical protein